MSGEHLGCGIAPRLCWRQWQRAAGRAALLSLWLLDPGLLPLDLALLLLRLPLLLRAADRRHSAIRRPLALATTTASPTRR